MVSIKQFKPKSTLFKKYKFYNSKLFYMRNKSDTFGGSLTNFNEQLFR